MTHLVTFLSLALICSGKFSQKGKKFEFYNFFSFIFLEELILESKYSTCVNYSRYNTRKKTIWYFKAVSKSIMAAQKREKSCGISFLYVWMPIALKIISSKLSTLLILLDQMEDYHKLYKQETLENKICLKIILKLALQ